MIYAWNKQFSSKKKKKKIHELMLFVVFSTIQYPEYLIKTSVNVNAPTQFTCTGYKT